MKHDIVTLRCDDGAEVVTFNKYTFTKLLCGDDGDEVVKDTSYEINVEDSFVGGCYRGFFGRIKRAWDAFWAKPVYYSCIYTDDKEKIRTFLLDSLNLLESE